MPWGAEGKSILIKMWKIRSPKLLGEPPSSEKAKTIQRDTFSNKQRGDGKIKGFCYEYSRVSLLQEL